MIVWRKAAGVIIYRKTACLVVWRKTAGAIVEELLDFAVALFGDLVERLALGLGAPDNAHNQGNKKNDAHNNSCGEEAGRIRGDVAHDGANAYE